MWVLDLKIMAFLSLQTKYWRAAKVKTTSNLLHFPYSLSINQSCNCFSDTTLLLMSSHFCILLHIDWVKEFEKNTCLEFSYSALHYTYDEPPSEKQTHLLIMEFHLPLYPFVASLHTTVPEGVPFHL